MIYYYRIIFNMKNYYFFIDDLDVTNDKIPDGILVRKVKLDFSNKKILYLKNFYITSEKLFNSDIYNKTKRKINNLGKYLISNMNLFRVHLFDVDKKLIPHIIISKNSYFYKNKSLNYININKFYNFLSNN